MLNSGLLAYMQGSISVLKLVNIYNVEEYNYK